MLNWLNGFHFSSPNMFFPALMRKATSCSSLLIWTPCLCVSQKWTQSGPFRWRFFFLWQYLHANKCIPLHLSGHSFFFPQRRILHASPNTPQQHLQSDLNILGRSLQKFIYTTQLSIHDYLRNCEHEHLAALCVLWQPNFRVWQRWAGCHVMMCCSRSTEMGLHKTFHSIQLTTTRTCQITIHIHSQIETLKKCK